MRFSLPCFRTSPKIVTIFQTRHCQKLLQFALTFEKGLKSPMFIEFALLMKWVRQRLKTFPPRIIPDCWKERTNHTRRLINYTLRRLTFSYSLYQGVPTSLLPPGKLWIIVYNVVRCAFTTEYHFSLKQHQFCRKSIYDNNKIKRRSATSERFVSSAQFRGHVALDNFLLLLLT